MKRLVILLILTFIGSSSMLFAQYYLQISGNIVDVENNEAMPGVSVLLKGTATGTVSDINGHYILEVNSEEPVLEFSYIAYKTQTISVEGRHVINVVMEVDDIRLHEWLVCKKTYFTPRLESSSYFPFGLSLDFSNNKFKYCCDIRYKTKLNVSYGSNFKSNEIIQARFGIEHVKILKARLGIAGEYDRINLSVNDADSLISDYKFSILIDDLLKYFKCEAGIGNQTFNTLNNTGFGLKLTGTNDIDYQDRYFRFLFSSGYWNWKEYNEFSVGLSFMHYFKRAKYIDNINYGFNLKKIDKLNMISFNLGLKLVVKSQMIGCG